MKESEALRAGRARRIPGDERGTSMTGIAISLCLAIVVGALFVWSVWS